MTISLAKVIKYATDEVKEAKLITLRPTVQPIEKKVEEISDEDKKKLAQIEREIIEKAEAKAKQLLEQTEVEMEKRMLAMQEKEAALEEKIANALEEAQAKGYDEGFQVGKKEGYASIQQSIEAAQRLVSLSKVDYEKKILEAEPMIIKLATKLAEKIVGDNIEQEPTKWVHIVQTAIKEMKEHKNIKISVHPSKYELTLNGKKQLEATLNHDSEIYIYPNEELDEDACLIETSFGTVDASVTTQLSEMKTHLLEIVEENLNE